MVGRTGGKMLFQDPVLMLQLLKLQEREQEKRLELARLLQEATESQPSLAGRALLRVSDALIATGERLRERYTPLADSCAVGPACAIES
jgi:hypothetical protein